MKIMWAFKKFWNGDLSIYLVPTIYYDAYAKGDDRGIRKVHLLYFAFLNIRFGFVVD